MHGGTSATLLVSVCLSAAVFGFVGSDWKKNM